MKRQPGIAVLGLGALAAGAVGVVLLWPSEMAEFTFPAVDGQGSLTYQCYPAVTPQQTELNARAAHAFFEPELRRYIKECKTSSAVFSTLSGRVFLRGLLTGARPTSP